MEKKELFVLGLFLGVMFIAILYFVEVGGTVDNSVLNDLCKEKFGEDYEFARGFWDYQYEFNCVKKLKTDNIVKYTDNLTIRLRT